MLGNALLFFWGKVMFEFAVGDFLKNSAVLVFQDLLDLFLEARECQEGSVVRLARGDELSRFIDERFNAPGPLSGILGLDMEKRAFVFDLAIEAWHLFSIILSGGQISSILWSMPSHHIIPPLISPGGN